MNFQSFGEFEEGTLRGGQGCQMSAGFQCCRLFSSVGPSSTRVQQPDQGTARASGQEGGGPAWRKESWAAAAAPPVGLSAPPTPSEAEPAPARRSSRRRRGRSRLQEPLETESPAAAVAAGAAHRQASEHRAAGAGGKSGPRGDRGAALGVGRPVREPPPSSWCWEARWREGMEKGRKEGRVSRRAGTGRGTGRRRPRWGWRARDAKTGRRTARSPSTGGGQMAREAGGPAGLGLGTRSLGRGLKQEERSPLTLAPRPARSRAPRARLGLEGSGVPRWLQLRWCQVWEEGRQLRETGAPRPSFLLSSALSGD